MRVLWQHCILYTVYCILYSVCGSVSTTPHNSSLFGHVVTVRLRPGHPVGSLTGHTKLSGLTLWVLLWDRQGLSVTNLLEGGLGTYVIVPVLQIWKKFQNFTKVHFHGTTFSWCTECNAKKTSALCKVWSRKKSRQKLFLCNVGQKRWLFLGVYKELRFLALHSVHHDASFDPLKPTIGQFFRFLTHRGDPYDLGG